MFKMVEMFVIEMYIVLSIVEFSGMGEVGVLLIVLVVVYVVV